MPQIVHVGPAPVSPAAREERVRLRDGVRLATDVYLPGAPADPDATPGDTILIRLPYDKSGEYTFIPLIAEYFTDRGYRVVAQDVRGKFRSEGDALLFVNEVDDGYDTIEWIVSQSWSNGRVAMWGDSYYGYTQWAAVASQHPALKAIAPRVTGTMLGEPVRAVAGERTRPVEWAITYLYPLTYFHSQDAYFWELDPHGAPSAPRPRRSSPSSARARSRTTSGTRAPCTCPGSRSRVRSRRVRFRPSTRSAGGTTARRCRGPTSPRSRSGPPGR